MKVPPHLGLERRIELLLCFVGRGGRIVAGHQDKVRLEVIAEVGGFFTADPVGLGLGALVVFSGVIEPAVATGVEVRVALGAGVTICDAAARGVLNLVAAFPAQQSHQSSVVSRSGLDLNLGAG